MSRNADVVSVVVGEATKTSLKRVGVLIPHVVRQALNEILDDYEAVGNPVPAESFLVQYRGDSVDQLIASRERLWQEFHDIRAESIATKKASETTLRFIHILNGLILEEQRKAGVKS